jgi:hypothetical protein
VRRRGSDAGSQRFPDADARSSRRRLNGGFLDGLWFGTCFPQLDRNLSRMHFDASDVAFDQVAGSQSGIYSKFAPSKMRPIKADTIVMATARASENVLYHLLRERGRSVEAIGCAVAPRTVYEAALEGHRAARKLGARR